MVRSVGRMSQIGPLGQAVARALGAEVTSSTVVRCGDVAQAFRLDLADGRRVFAKTHPDPPPGFFTTEAAGLAWLRDADAVLVPEVLGVSDGAADEPSFVVLEWIDIGSARPETEGELGGALARLHRAAAPCFGREDPSHHGQPGAPQRALLDVGRALRHAAAGTAGPPGS